jgi:hypothetical protein
MPNPLVPTISGNQLSVSSLLGNPTRLNGMIARLAAEQLVCDAFFRPASSAVVGGQLLFDVLVNGGNFAARDVELRTPGAEYIITTGDVTRDQAVPKDWGAKVQILDEERTRLDPTVLANRLVQLANSISRKIDQLAIAAVDAALAKYSIASVPGHDWSTLVTVGPSTGITPNADRPTADISNASLLARVDDLGIAEPDTIVMHPGQLQSLRQGYGSELPDVLAGVGIQNVRTSLQVAEGTAYVVTAGAAGVMGFEATPYGQTAGQLGLATELIPDREHRAVWIQSNAVTVFATVVPGSVRRLTGLSGA